MLQTRTVTLELERSPQLSTALRPFVDIAQVDLRETDDAGAVNVRKQRTIVNVQVGLTPIRQVQQERAFLTLLPLIQAPGPQEVFYNETPAIDYPAFAFVEAQPGVFDIKFNVPG